jgi:hypothetical protein
MSYSESQEWGRLTLRLVKSLSSSYKWVGVGVKSGED